MSEQSGTEPKLTAEQVRFNTESPYRVAASNARALGLSARADQIEYWGKEASDTAVREFEAKQKGLDPRKLDGSLDEEVRRAVVKACTEAIDPQRAYLSGFTPWASMGRGIFYERTDAYANSELEFNRSRQTPKLVEEIKGILGAQQRGTFDGRPIKVGTVTEWDTDIGVVLRISEHHDRIDIQAVHPDYIDQTWNGSSTYNSNQVQDIDLLPGESFV